MSLFFEKRERERGRTRLLTTITVATLDYYAEQKYCNKSYKKSGKHVLDKLSYKKVGKKGGGILKL